MKKFCLIEYLGIVSLFFEFERISLLSSSYSDFNFSEKSSGFIELIINCDLFLFSSRTRGGRLMEPAAGIWLAFDPQSCPKQKQIEPTRDQKDTNIVSESPRFFSSARAHTEKKGAWPNWYTTYPTSI